MKDYTEVQVTINELYTAFMGAVNLILTCGATATHWLLVLLPIPFLLVDV